MNLSIEGVDDMCYVIPSVLGMVAAPIRNNVHCKQLKIVK